jgi:hypothetical protein
MLPPTAILLRVSAVPPSSPFPRLIISLHVPSISSIQLTSPVEPQARTMVSRRANSSLHCTYGNDSLLIQILRCTNDTLSITASMLQLREAHPRVLDVESE